MSLLNDTSVSFLDASTASVTMQRVSTVSMATTQSSADIELSCSPQGVLQLSGTNLLAPGNFLLLTVNGQHFKMLLDPTV